MEDFENTYRWLDIGNRPWRGSFQALLSQALAEANAGNFATSLTSLSDFETSVVELGNDLDKGRRYIERARVNLAVQDAHQATLDLRQAVQALDEKVGYDTEYRHFRFISSWLLGFLLWSTDRQEATAAWQSSLDDITCLWRQYKHIVPEGAWYWQHILDMRGRIEQALRAKPSHSPFLLWKVLPRLELHTSHLDNLPVVGEIPAGRKGPFALDVEPLEEIPLRPLMEEFWIEDAPHHLYNLRGNVTSLTLAPSLSYYILKVESDSMDLIGIYRGDYVLIRQQTMGENGDIVAVEVVEEDDCATLKHYFRYDDKVILKPQSTYAYHRQFEFSPQEYNRYAIRGTALGVFKQF